LFEANIKPRLRMYYVEKQEEKFFLAEKYLPYHSFIILYKKSFCPSILK